MRPSTTRTCSIAGASTFGDDESATLAALQPRTLRLVNDSEYIARLKSKLVKLLTEEGANGAVIMSPSFTELDRRFRGGRRSQTKRQSSASSCSSPLLTLWDFKRYFGSVGLSDTELEVLFAMFLDESERQRVLASNGSVPVGGSDLVDACQGDSRHRHSSHRSAKSVSTAVASPVDPDVVTVDAAEVLLALRKLCHTISVQFHDIIKRVRARRLRPDDLDADGVPLCKFYAKYITDGRVAKKREVFDFCVDVLKMTESEAYLFLEYISLASLQPRTSANCNDSDDGINENDDDEKPVPIDMEYTVAILFEHPLPDDIAFPLLLSKLVETISNPARGDCSGLSYVLEEMLFFTDGLDASGSVQHQKSRLTAEEVTRLGFEEGYVTSVVPYAGVLSTTWLDIGTFKRFCHRTTAGLPAGEVELLFGFLVDSNNASLQKGRILVNAAALVEQIQLRIPRVPPAELYRCAAVIKQQLFCGSEGVHALNTLHDRLSMFATNRKIPPLTYRMVMRDLGVSGDAVPTVMLDALRGVAPRCVQMVSLIRGPVSSVRTNLLRKLFVLLYASDQMQAGKLLSDSGRDARISPSRSRPSVSKDSTSTHDQNKICFDGRVRAATVLERYNPALAVGVVPPTQAAYWFKHLRQYIESLCNASAQQQSGLSLVAGGPLASTSVARQLLPAGAASPAPNTTTTTTSCDSDLLTFDEFAYYWSNLSAGIDDDDAFTMLLWKGFSMFKSHTSPSPFFSECQLNDKRNDGSSLSHETPSRSQQQRERRFLRD